MSEVSAKRNVTQIQPVQTKRQDIEKKVSKPGRKPINSEPKNKRTAQNRAAQRAFRERKEKKMKELEDRVQELEDENKAANTESELLRMQVEMLSQELLKYREGGAVVAKVSAATTPGTLAGASPATSKKIFDFPWSNMKYDSAVVNQNLAKSVAYSESLVSSKGESSLSPSSDSASNSNSNVDTPASDLKKTSKTYDFDFNKHYDQSNFCGNLSMACGTKDCPQPELPNRTYSSVSYGDSAKDDSLDFTKSVTTATTPSLTKPDEDFAALMEVGNGEYQFNLDDLDFLKDPDSYRDVNPESNFALFDGSNEELAPINDLINEESSYDPFNIDSIPGSGGIIDDMPSGSNLKAPVGFEFENVNGDDDDDNAVVPAKEERLMACTEMWDRVTTHPKYTDLDIDGLCDELRAKAKCSDKGVLVDKNEFEKIISKHQ